LAIGFKTLIKDEYFNIDINVQPGDCSVLNLPTYLPNGLEDAQITKNGIVIASTPRIPAWIKKDNSKEGYYHTFDLKSQNPKFIKLKVNGIKVGDLFPHGISIYEDPLTNKISLFTVNHAVNRTESVIIYDFNENNNELTVRYIATDPLFYALNSVVAVGPNSFYATNDRGLPVEFREIEIVLGLAICDVVYHDGTTQTTIKAAESIIFANGITASKDFSRIFVSSMSDKTLIEYSRKQDNTLRTETTHFIGFYADNIHVDENDHIWNGGVTHLLQMAAHMKDPSKLAPSAVGRYIPKTDNTQLVYVNNGSVISGVTSAVRWKNKLVIAPLKRKIIVICDLPESGLYA